MIMLTFDVSSTAVLHAMHMGLGEDPEQLVSLLSNFARHSTRVTHPKGNRRYGGYVLDVNGPRVYDVAKFDGRPVCQDCHGTGKHQMRDRGRWVDVPCQNPHCTEKAREFAYG